MAEHACRLRLAAKRDDPHALAFQADLALAYQALAQRAGWRMQLESREDAGDARQIDFLVEGPGVASTLAGESGLHRAQRIAGDDVPLATAIVRVGVYDDLGVQLSTATADMIRRTYHFQISTVTDHRSQRTLQLAELLAGKFE